MYERGGGLAHAVWRAGGKWLIASNVILVVQGVPALDLLVLVLQTLIPVLQPLPLGSDTQLTPTCQEGRQVWKAGGEQVRFFGFILSKQRNLTIIYRCSRWTSRCHNPTQRYLKSSWPVHCVWCQGWIPEIGSRRYFTISKATSQHFFIPDLQSDSIIIWGWAYFYQL